MSLRELVLKNRSYRRFDESIAISLETLREFVNLARLSASGGNRQPLKYILSAERACNARIFKTLRWAGYLKDWKGPAEGERPAAYIVILGDTEVTTQFGCDRGIAAETILLRATESGLGGCMIGSIDRDGLRASLQISDRYEILLVIALGKPAERVVVEESTEEKVKYWRDDQGVHHVPKRSLEEIIVSEYAA